MKITIAAITALVLAAAPFALAQEEQSSPSPASSPEATAPEKTETTDTSVSVTTEKTASPAPNASTSPAATKKSSPPAKSSAGTTPTQSASPSAVMPTKKSSAEATLKEIEDKWEASVMTHDPSVAQAFVAGDFRGVSSKGKPMSKSNLLAELKKDTDVYASTKNSKVDVRVFDGKFAVVTGIATEVGKAKDGKAFKRNFRWTDAWLERGGKWQCVASQAMLIP